MLHVGAGDDDVPVGDDGGHNRRADAVLLLRDADHQSQPTWRARRLSTGKVVTAAGVAGKAAVRFLPHRQTTSRAPPYQQTVSLPLTLPRVRPRRRGAHTALS